MDALTTPAVVAVAPSAVVVRDEPRRPIAPTDVVIRTTYSGVSNGTDRWVMTGRFRPGMDFPLVPGYQRAGVVVEVGPAVTRFRPGQFVAATSASDLAIDFSGGHVGLTASAEQDVYDANGVDPRAAALVVVAQVGGNAASRVVAPVGARIVVVGDGVIGACGALAARARGFEVLCVGRHDERLATIAAASPGIEVLNARTGDTAAIAGWEPIAVIDTVQSDSSFASYLEVLPHGTGQVIFSGHSPDGVASWGSMAELQRRELTAHFVSGWTHERMKGTIRLLRSGMFPVEGLVGRIARGNEEIVEVMDQVIAGTLPSVATVIEWNAP